MEFTRSLFSWNTLPEHAHTLQAMMRLRHSTFIMGHGWDLPCVDGMEYDQYDTPAAWYGAVHDANGTLVAGMRFLPTTHRIGCYSYMLRDAARGLLEPSLPRTLLYADAPVHETIWEVTRGFVAPTLTDTVRRRVRPAFLALMHDLHQHKGATQILAIMPSNWPRWTKRVGLAAHAMGPVVDIQGPHQALSFPFPQP